MASAVLYPDVPDSAGVPPVRRSPTQPTTPAAAKLSGDSDSVERASAQQWGVYDQGGAQIIEPDNIVAMSYGVEYRIGDYPVAPNGFESYDKVTLPFGTRVIVSKGGSLSDRRAFLSTLELLRGSTDLYNVVTPEAVYSNVNIEQVSMDRSQSAGAGLLTVELHLREIRQTAAVAFSKSKDPASASVTHNGSVQTTPSTADASQIK